MTDDATEGTYTLLLAIDAPLSIEVGALGVLEFPAEAYCYTGTAFGPGGFARVERHRELAAGERETRHWHVDYLLGDPGTSIAGVWTSPGADRECEVSAALPGEPVAGFGASDCDCPAHLVSVPNREATLAALDRVHEQRGLPGATD